MPNKDLLFFLVETDGRVRQIVNGVVTSLATKRHLPHAPIGSQEISIGWERSMQWWGNIRNFSLPLGFVFEGGKIIRNDAYKFNVDRELDLLILRFVSEIDNTYYKDYYKYLYKGRLDFSTFEDKQGVPVVQISIMEGGINKLLKSQSQTQFNIPLDDEADNIKMDGIHLEGSGLFNIASEIEIGHHVTASTERTAFAPINFISRDGTAAGLAFLSQTVEVTGNASWATRTSSTNRFAEGAASNTSTVNAEISGTLRWNCVVGTIVGVRFRIIRSNQLEINKDDYLMTPMVVPLSGQNFEQDIDITVPVEPGERLYFEIVFYGGGFNADIDIQFLQDTDITVSFFSRFPTTYIKAFRPYILYKRICAEMGISENKIVSEALLASNIFITSGDGVRGLPNAVVKTNFNDFFKAFSTYLMAGVAVEGETGSEKLYFEKFDHFFVRDSVLAATELGQAKDMVIKEAVDLYFSSIKVGHAEQQTDDVNGKFDPNGYLIFTSPQKTVTRELNLQSPYKAGPIEIEIKRQNYEGKTTTDSDIDNDVYAIVVDLDSVTPFSNDVMFDNVGNWILFEDGDVDIVAGTKFSTTGSVSNNGTFTATRVDRYPNDNYTIVYVAETITVLENATITVTIISGGVYTLDRSITVASVSPDASALLAETIFNIAITPKRILQTWYTWIRSFLYKYDGEKLIHKSENRNADLIAGGIVESADVNVSEMGTPIALPFYMEHATQVPISLCETLETTPNRCFANDWMDVRRTGYLWNAGLAPVMRGEQTYKLLMTNENDPEDLIF